MLCLGLLEMSPLLYNCLFAFLCMRSCSGMSGRCWVDVRGCCSRGGTWLGLWGRCEAQVGH